MMIDLAHLADHGLLSPEELQVAQTGSGDRIDFDAVEAVKMPLLRVAASRLLSDSEHPWQTPLEAFRQDAKWLDDVLLFECIKGMNDGQSWTEWPESQRDRHPDEIARIAAEHADWLAEGAAIAFFFETQWSEVRLAAEAHGIQIFGDLPIYVAQDSADVWANRDVFELRPDGVGIEVAAVPPDAFSDTGQLWGNPLYNWEALKADGCNGGLINRAGADGLRCPSGPFRGFSRYYAVAGDAETPLEVV